MNHLTYELAEEIRAKHAAGGLSHQDLATEYGVSRRMIGFVLKRECFVSPDSTRLKHGHYRGRDRWSNGSPTMITYNAMHSRCTDPTRKDYHGNGIKVCERWHTFENFVADMGERPKGYTLDRIDPNQGYWKSNCRWACKALQQHNRKDAKLSWEKIERIKWMRSEGFTQQQIATEFGVHQATIGRVLNGKRWKAELPPIQKE